MKKVYVAMSADIIHPGHINVIEKASELGEVIIGLLTDDAISKHKKLPLMDYNQRSTVLSNIKNVSQIVPQDDIDQISNITQIKPNYVVCGNDKGDDFSVGHKKQIIDKLREWGGALVEVEHTKGVSSSYLKSCAQKISTTPDIRRSALRKLLSENRIIRILESHNGLSGRIAETLSVDTPKGDKEFDGIWSSSLTDSTARSKPDIEAVDLTSRLNTINEILEVTTKPIIFDADTGGLIEHFTFTVRTLERIGVSALVIEDKIGLKKNSLLGNSVTQQQDTIDNFCKKIQAGKESQMTKEFMIVARIESLILQAGLNDAITRAREYINAGADAIMIHSKEKDPQEVLGFCKQYSKFNHKVPLVAVPTTYSSITEDELYNAGVNLVIYANHMLRSAYPNMVSAAKSILENQRCKEADEYCMSVKEILKLIPGTI